MATSVNYWFAVRDLDTARALCTGGPFSQYVIAAGRGMKAKQEQALPCTSLYVEIEQKEPSEYPATCHVMYEDYGHRCELEYGHIRPHRIVLEW